MTREFKITYTTKDITTYIREGGKRWHKDSKSTICGTIAENMAEAVRCYTKFGWTLYDLESNHEISGWKEF